MRKPKNMRLKPNQLEDAHKKQLLRRKTRELNKMVKSVSSMRKSKTKLITADDDDEKIDDKVEK